MSAVEPMDESCGLTNGVDGGRRERHVGLIDIETSKNKETNCHEAEAKWITLHADTERQISTQKGINDERWNTKEVVRDRHAGPYVQKHKPEKGGVLSEGSTFQSCFILHSIH